MAAEDYENTPPGQSGVDASVLNTIQGSSAPVQLNVDDFSGYVPQDLSPDMQQAYSFQMRPTTGALSPNDYYPDLNNQINVGNYSGSEVGSLSLFAPGGGLVPLGLMDAREAAIQKAALQKAMEVENFKNQYKSPVTKHTTVQPELDKLYQEGNEKWWNNALKKSGGDPALASRLLQNDPNFKAWNQSAQTAAKIEDSVVDRFAKIHDDVKTGKFVYTPELRKAEDDFWSAYNGLGSSPFNKSGHNLNNEWLKLNAEHDFANVANEYIKEAVKEKDAAAGVDVSNPDYIKTIETTKEGFTPETLKTIAASMQQTHFPDMSLQDIEKRITGMYGEMKETKNISVQQKREPSSGADINHDVKDVAEEVDEINGNVINTDGTKSSGSYETFDRLTLKKPIKIILPVGTKAVDLEAGGVPDKNIENTEAEIGNVYNAYTYKNPYGEGAKSAGFEGMMVDKNLRKDSNVKKGIVVTPMVTVRYKTKDKNGKEVIQSNQVPLSSVKNSLIGRNGQNEEVLNHIEKKAAERTSSLNSDSKQTSGSTKSSSYTIKGKKYSLADLQKMGYTEQQVAKYKK